MTADELATLIVNAKTDRAAFTMKQRMDRQRDSALLYEGGKCPADELTRVTEFCELLAATMRVDHRGDAHWTGETQELVQVLLRKQSQPQ